jgi:hypothetical protein
MIYLEFTRATYAKDLSISEELTFIYLRKSKDFSFNETCIFFKHLLELRNQTI